MNAPDREAAMAAIRETVRTWEALPPVVRTMLAATDRRGSALHMALADLLAAHDALAERVRELEEGQR